MLINRWKKDKEKDKSTSTLQTTSGTNGSTSATLSKPFGGSVKKKRKSGKEGKLASYDEEHYVLEKIKTCIT